MKISQEGISLIKKFEGCELEAYQDAVGIWTIGYGHIKGVKEGMTITKQQAEEMLVHELTEYEQHVLQCNLVQSRYWRVGCEQCEGYGLHVRQRIFIQSTHWKMECEQRDRFDVRIL